MHSPADLPRTPLALRGRLFLMMFLQYFVQGCYLPVAALYVRSGLGFSQEETAYFNSALAVGPLLAPFIIGQIVDRHFATETVLAVCHLVAGILMFGLYTQTTFTNVMLLGTLYSILYVPTMMLTNSLAFAHLADRDREFPLVRVWGTIGFILPLWMIELVWLRGLTGQELDHARSVVFLLSAVAGVVMAFYCLTLPHTPPQKNLKKDFAPAAALSMLRDRSLLVLVLVSFFVAMVHSGFFVWNSPFLKSVLARSAIEGAWEGRIASLGQIAEIAVMSFLSLIILKLGLKATLVVGASAYAVRCVLLALAAAIDPPYALPLACIGQTLHGFCFGCFLATAYMYVDRVATPDVRGSIQNIYGTFVIGLGFVAGGWLAGRIDTWFSQGTTSDWTSNWMASAAIAAASALALAYEARRDRAAAREQAA
jgi:nucleoside transporter